MTQLNNYGITKDNLAASSGLLIDSNNLSDVLDAGAANQNLFSNAVVVPTFVDNITTLDDTFLGKHIALQNGGPAGVVNLPIATTFSLLSLYNINGVSPGVMQIVPNGAETINGVSSLTIGVGDNVSLIGFMGVGWTLAQNNVAPAYCNVTRSAVQTIPGGVSTKVQFTFTTFDVNGFFDVSTDYDYNPLLPGVYQVSASATLDSTGAGGVATFAISILKNGSPIQTTSAGNIVATTSSTLSSATTVQMNGSTDALTVVVLQDSATSPALDIAATCTFTAVRVGNL